MRKQLNEALDLITSQRDEKRSLEGKAAKLVGGIHYMIIRNDLCINITKKYDYVNIFS